MKDLKSIKRVIQTNELIDTVLNKTQRKTPTIVRRKWQIPRIREFYINKIKFCGNEYIERLDEILENFPIIEELHPFYGDLLNVLYDKANYKMSLGHISSSKKIIKDISKDYLKLLKYGDSLYRCKLLKTAGFGKMTTVIKRLKPTLIYLEEVRQHMSRLPDIDPTKRTLLLCGLPNVGKSSFINKISKATVDVQPYAFTTKSLFVGHFDHRFVEWQVVDTPGILDHPVSEMNSIEMQSVTALAHLNSVVIFLLDPSGTCGYSVESQINLCNSILPLLNSKILIVLSKSDIEFKMCEDLKRFLSDKEYLFLSSNNNFNVQEVKNKACEMLLEFNLIEKADKIESIAHKINIVKPETEYDKGTNNLREEPIKTERQKELENLDYSFDEKKFSTVNEEWKYDIVPEIYAGRNIADYVDNNILEEALKLLEEEKDVMEVNYNLLTEQEKEDLEKLFIEIKRMRSLADRKRRKTMPEKWKHSELKKNIKAYEEENKLDVMEVREKVSQRAIPNKEKYYDKLPKHLSIKRSKR
ncbi:Nucleolar GTP-binding protein 1 [Cucumispora dikerogammari]|nr:Nucleolar GTP-binding protein 1 [Cucumispora dikerogammari]